MRSCPLIDQWYYCRENTQRICKNMKERKLEQKRAAQDDGLSAMDSSMIWLIIRQMRNRRRGTSNGNDCLSMLKSVFTQTVPPFSCSRRFGRRWWRWGGRWSASVYFLLIQVPLKQSDSLSNLPVIRVFDSRTVVVPLVASDFVRTTCFKRIISCKPRSRGTEPLTSWLKIVQTFRHEWWHLFSECVTRWIVLISCMGWSSGCPSLFPIFHANLSLTHLRSSFCLKRMLHIYIHLVQWLR